MGDYTCEICDPVKTFTRRADLKRHVKQVHEKEKRYKCGICQKEFARKAHKDFHHQVCLYKVNSGHCKIEFTPVHVSTDWKVDIPADYHAVAPYPLLREAINAFRDPILKYNVAHMQKLKFTVSAYVVFQQASDPEIKTEPPVVLTTNRWIVYPGTDDRKQLNRAYDDLVRGIEGYEGTGSGWVIDYLNSLSIITIMSF